MTVLDLAAIRARAEAATPGPWRTRASHDNSGDVGIVAPSVARNVIAECFAAIRSSSERALTEASANAAHIAGMDPPTMLALVDALIFARKEHDAIVHEDTKKWRKQADRADAAEAEAAKLQARVTQLEGKA